MVVTVKLVMIMMTLFPVDLVQIMVLWFFRSCGISCQGCITYSTWSKYTAHFFYLYYA